MVKIACMFPGQGTQFIGMGKELFEKYEDYVERANDILGYSIKKLCLDESEKLLNQTEYTQVSVFFVNVLLYLEFIRNTRITPDFVLGHSLGEYNALFASGVFDFETGLQLVKERGKLMAEIDNTGMAAVIGMEIEDIYDILKNQNMKNIEIANYNTKNQIVISGSKDQLDLAKDKFIKKGVYYKNLKVSGAFHSKYMKEIAKKFENILCEKKFNKISIPVYSNVTAELYTNENIKSLLVEHMYRPVRWYETIKKLIDIEGIQFEQIGYGKVLVNILNSIYKEK